MRRLLFSVSLLSSIPLGAEENRLPARVLVDNISERIMRLELNPSVSYQAAIKQYWGDISVLDLRSGRKSWTYHQINLSFSDFGLAWSQSGFVLAAGGDAPVVLDARDGSIRTKLEVPHSNFVVTAMAFSPDDRLVAGATYDEDNSIAIWDAENGKLLSQLPSPNLSEEQAYDGAVRLRFSQDAQMLFGAGGQWVAVWNVEAKKLIKTIDLRKLLNTRPGFSVDGGSFAFTRDLRFVAMNDNNNVIIVSLESLRIVRQLKFPSYPRLYEFTDDNESLMIAGLGVRGFEPPQPLEPYQFQFGKINIVTGEVSEIRSTEKFDFLPNEHTAATSGLRVAGFDLQTGYFIIAAGRDPKYKNASFESFRTHQIFGWNPSLN